MESLRRKIAATFILTISISLMITSTLAFFTDMAYVQNVHVTIPEIRLTIDESKVDEWGNRISGSSRVKENIYLLCPGFTYVKDPVIHISKNSYECYVFVKVKNGLKNLEKEEASIHNQMTQNGWVKVDGTEDVYYYSKIATAGEDIPVFETFSIDGNTVTGGIPPEGEKESGIYYLDDYKDQKITIEVYASQVLGFHNQVDAWFTAFNK